MSDKKKTCPATSAGKNTGEAMQTSRCVLILPFDFYEEVDDARQGTLLETPHWESWAITLAHWMAQRSREKLLALSNSSWEG